MNGSKTCPYCAETIRREAIKCRYCGSHLEPRAFAGEWTRKEEGRMIAGVCAGLAERFDVSVTAIRLAFVLAFLLGFGMMLPIYIILWIVMPLEERPILPEFADDVRLDDPGHDGRPPPIS